STGRPRAARARPVARARARSGHVSVTPMPEGDTLHRTANRLQALVGQRIEASSPHPRALAERVAERIDGRVLQAVEAHGKNLLLRFDGGVVVRSHLRMSGRWTLRPRGEARSGRPWLVLRGERYEGVLWNGPVLELHARAARPRHPRTTAANRRDARTPSPRRRHTPPRRVAARSVARRRHRQRVARRDALAGAALAVAAAARRPRRGPAARARDGGRADARLRRHRPGRPAPGVQAGGPAVPTLRHGDPGARPGRRQPDGLLVSGLPERRGAARRVLRPVLRAPHLYESLRAFCLAAFAAERGAQVPFAFEEHATREGPSLYEYRPLIRGFVEEQSPTLRRLPDTRNALDDLKREPAAAIFARAHAGLADTDDDALFRSILLPMLTWTAERCGGFDWRDDAFDAAYADLEQTLFGSARTYVALAPVVGLSCSSQVDLGGDISLRPVVTGEISQLWPEAQGLAPPQFGRDVDRLLVLEWKRELGADEADAPDAAAELADAVTALRLATAGAVAAGPVVFERLDFRPLRISPLLPIAASQPHGEPTRLDRV